MMLLACSCILDTVLEIMFAANVLEIVDHHRGFVLNAGLNIQRGILTLLRMEWHQKRHIRVTLLISRERLLLPGNLHYVD